MPAVLDDVLFPAVLELPPDSEVFALDPDVVAVPEVFDATGVADVVEGTAAFGELLEAEPAVPVMVTDMYAWSVPTYVTVDMPGKLASSPPADSTQTAEVVPAREQSR
jgi:hypothetical protein